MVLHTDRIYKQGGLENQPFFETVSFSHNTTTHSDYIAGVRLLTVCRVRDIRFPLSWHPASVDNEHGAKPPKAPPILYYQGKMMC